MNPISYKDFINDLSTKINDNKIDIEPNLWGPRTIKIGQGADQKVFESFDNLLKTLNKAIDDPVVDAATLRKLKEVVVKVHDLDVSSRSTFQKICAMIYTPKRESDFDAVYNHININLHSKPSKTENSALKPLLENTEVNPKNVQVSKELLGLDGPYTKDDLNRLYIRTKAFETGTERGKQIDNAYIILNKLFK
jgi:hypothetical protein